MLALARVYHAKKNLYLNQLLARQENIEWHYRPVICDSADQFSDSSGLSSF